VVISPVTVKWPSDILYVERNIKHYGVTRFLTRNEMKKSTDGVETAMTATTLICTVCDYENTLSESDK